MAEELSPAVVSTHHGEEAGEVKDRGMFEHFLGKKDEKNQEEGLVAGVEKIHIDEEEKPVEQEEVKKNSLRDKLLESQDSNSSLSSDEEKAKHENEEMSEKKELNDEINGEVHCNQTEEGDLKESGMFEHFLGKKDEKTQEVVEEDKFEEAQEVVEVAQEDDTTVEVEKMDTTTVGEAVVPEEEKKGLLEKMQEKLDKKPVEERVEASPPVVPPPAVECGEQQVKEQEGEKKGLLTKIKEKLPGFQKSSGDEGEKNAASE